MSGEYLVTALIFIVVGVALMALVSRLFRFRGLKDESAGSNEHGVSWDVDGGCGGGDGGD